MGKQKLTGKQRQKVRAKKMRVLREQGKGKNFPEPTLAQLGYPPIT